MTQSTPSASAETIIKQFFPRAQLLDGPDVFGRKLSDYAWTESQKLRPRSLRRWLIGLTIFMLFAVGIARWIETSGLVLAAFFVCVVVLFLWFAGKIGWQYRVSYETNPEFTDLEFADQRLHNMVHLTEAVGEGIIMFRASYLQSNRQLDLMAIYACVGNGEKSERWLLWCDIEINSRPDPAESFSLAD